MALSSEMRRLETKWTTGNRWPQFLNWLEIKQIRGWSGQRVEFKFPITAIVGENGSGKSTVLQSAACAYQTPSTGNSKTWFPSEFFPETAWDKLQNVRIEFGLRQGDLHSTPSIRKPTTRWLGQPDRPARRVDYIDLSRIQPVATRVGYARIAKNKHSERSAVDFTEEEISRLSQIMGRNYDSAKIAMSNIDDIREIPVLSKSNQPYSGFHQGSGETTIAELLKTELPKYGLVLVDEIESSLHARAQRRLMRDLAQVARDKECQIILTTHSPYILEELPLQARIYILESDGNREIVDGVSPQFAMTKMNDAPHPECELYVEDTRAQTWLREILSRYIPEISIRCSIIPYGAANLGVALGEMVENKRFMRPTVVFLDGDQDDSTGCMILPGGDAPERVIFNDLSNIHWRDLWVRIGRTTTDVDDALYRAMTLSEHKEWVKAAANELMCGSDVLWQAMCAEWAKYCTDDSKVKYIADRISDVMN